MADLCFISFTLNELKDSLSSNQKKSACRLHRRPPMESILSEMNPVQILIHFNIILP